MKLAAMPHLEICQLLDVVLFGKARELPGQNLDICLEKPISSSQFGVDRLTKGRFYPSEIPTKRQLFVNIQKVVMVGAVSLIQTFYFSGLSWCLSVITSTSLTCHRPQEETILTK